MERVRVSKDGRGFVLEGSGRAFSPWGFNYDHDEKGRLLEGYWETEWSKVETDFRAMKALGANLARIHLQFGKFMDGPDKPTEKSLARLADLLKLAEQTGLYLDLTGLGCYHKRDVPEWYDKLPEEERWAAQARFWQAVAARCAGSPAVFCYDLMNEPAVAGAPRKDGDWLGPAFGGKHFVQFIALDPRGRTRSAVARAWVCAMAAAIRKEDRTHLVTVGLLPGNAQRADLWSGFEPKELAELDFISVHVYPKKGQVEDALNILARFSVSKPVLVEETFPLHCSIEELGQFIDGAREKELAAGWVGFFWSRTPEQLRGSKDLGDTLTLGWLEFFQKKKPVK